MIFGQEIDQKIIQDIDKFVREDMKASGAPGAVVGIVKDEKIIYQKAYGLNDTKNKIPVNNTTLFLTASVTKVITTTALLLICDRNNIDVNTPVGEIIKDLPQALSQITIHEILSMSSGILDHWPTRKKYKEDFESYFLHYGDKLVVKELQSVFSYTNFGHVLAGWLLATLNNSSFTEAVDELIFEPLKMESSTFDIEIAKQRSYSLAYKNGKKVKHKLTYPLIQPAASLFSNINDLSRFAICFMNNGQIDGQLVIPGKVIQQMSTSYTKLGLLQPYFGYSNSYYNYGLIDFTYKGIRFLGHPGESTSQNILFAMVPKHKTAFIIMSNTGYYPFIKSFEKIAEYLLPANKNYDEKKKAKLDPDDLIGKYYTPNIYGNKEDIIEIVHQNKKLYIKFSDEEKYILTATENSSFTYKTSNLKFPIEIGFYKDKNEKVKYLNNFWLTSIKM